MIQVHAVCNYLLVLLTNINETGPKLRQMKYQWIITNY